MRFPTPAGRIGRGQGQPPAPKHNGRTLRITIVYWMAASGEPRLGINVRDCSSARLAVATSSVMPVVGARCLFLQRTMLKKSDMLPKGVVRLSWWSIMLAAASRVFRGGDLAMSSSRTRSRLAIAAMTFLTAMASGCMCPRTQSIDSTCICPRTQRIDCTCTRIFVESPIVSRTVVTQDTDQCPVADWVVRRESVERLGPLALSTTGPTRSK